MRIFEYDMANSLHGLWTQISQEHTLISSIWVYFHLHRLENL